MSSGFFLQRENLGTRLSRFPERLRQKKVCDEKKQKNCVHQVHVSEYVLNSMFQVGYSRTLVLFGSIVIEFSVSP